MKFEKKIRVPSNCEKNTIKYNVETAQCEYGTVKCEKKNRGTIKCEKRTDT